MRAQSGRLVGYARVSTWDQDTALQMDALKRAGCRSLFEERASGAFDGRPVLAACLKSLGPGDTLVVWKIDRLARSLRRLLSIADACGRAGAALKSLSEPIDTSTPLGEYLFQNLGSVAQLERSIIRERVVAGQRAARARGKVWGRPRILSSADIEVIVDIWRSGACLQSELADIWGVTVACLRDAIHRHERRGRWAAGELRH